jgi:hypothetical protein
LARVDFPPPGPPIETNVYTYAIELSILVLNNTTKFKNYFL